MYIYIMAEGDARDILERLQGNNQELISDLTSLSRKIAEKMALPAYILPEDIAQDVMLTLLAAVASGTFRGESSIRTFAYSVAVRTCLRRARELGRIADGEPDSFADPSPGAEQALLDEDQWRLARRIIAALPESCRSLWRLIFVEELSYREAAKRLNVKEVTVRERMSSCCRRARELARRIESATKRP